MIHNLKLGSDEDKDLAKLLTGYQDMLGLLNVHKVARINTQVYTLSFQLALHALCLSQLLFKCYIIMFMAMHLMLSALKCLLYQT